MNQISSKIRILMVLGNTRRGGTQSFVMNILRNVDLSKFQIDVAVVSDNDGGYGEEIRSLGSKLILIHSFKVFNWSCYVKRWDELLTETPYHIVHGHATNSAGIYLKVAKKHGCVTIAHIHSTGYRGNFIEQLTKRFFSKRTKKYADYWFACTNEAAKSLYGNSYIMYPYYFEIPNAIDVKKYSFNKQIRESIRNSLNLSDSTFLCGHVGTFSTPKNHLFLLEIFKEILTLKPESKLILIGEGYLEHAIVKRTHDLNIFDSVIFKKNLSNVNEYMMAMDLFIFPSIYEGFGIVALESQATGLNTIISDVIPHDILLSKCAVPLSLCLPANEWAKVALSLPTRDRKAVNVEIEESKYNLYHTVELIDRLYEQMVK